MKEKEIKLPNNWFEVIVDYLPNYSSRTDVLENDIMQRAILKEELSNEDNEWLAGIGNQKDIEKTFDDSSWRLYNEALIIKRYDKELIKDAKKLNCIDWSLININKAKSQIGRDKLSKIKVSLYLKEEAQSGNL